jgi:hypothetical protein
MTEQGNSGRKSVDRATKQWHRAREGIPLGECQFKDAADWQEVRNAQNLHSQQDMLSYLLWGVGCLLSALALGGIVQLLEAVETIS